MGYCFLCPVVWRSTCTCASKQQLHNWNIIVRFLFCSAFTICFCFLRFSSDIIGQTAAFPLLESNYPKRFQYYGRVSRMNVFIVQVVSPTHVHDNLHGARMGEGSTTFPTDGVWCVRRWWSMCFDRQTTTWVRPRDNGHATFFASVVASTLILYSCCCTLKHKIISSTTTVDFAHVS